MDALPCRERGLVPRVHGCPLCREHDLVARVHGRPPLAESTTLYLECMDAPSAESGLTTPSKQWTHDESFRVLRGQATAALCLHLTALLSFPRPVDRVRHLMRHLTQHLVQRLMQRPHRL
eukprot:302774-Chlamydomonas_euryale.AAC.1